MNCSLRTALKIVTRKKISSSNTLIRRIIFNNLNILRSSQRCKAAFPSPPLISFRRCNNLRDILVKAKHRRPPPKTPGAFRCSRNRCKTCPFITEVTAFYTFFSTNEHRSIRHHITCSSSNHIYIHDTVLQMQGTIHRRD